MGAQLASKLKALRADLQITGKRIEMNELLGSSPMDIFPLKCAWGGV